MAIYQPFSINIEVMYSPQILMLVLALFGVTFVSGVVMKLVMSSWAVDEVNTEDSLKNAGKYIGILERLFVFAFVVLNLWQAIGLLIAAKSVFRFGDLSRAKDRKLTEYILIGTLLSVITSYSIHYTKLYENTRISSRKHNAQLISNELDAGKNCVFVTLGDPMLYSTYSYVLEYLDESHKVETIPGIYSFSAISSLLSLPLCT